MKSHQGHFCVIVAAGMVWLGLAAAPARAQLKIENEDISMKFGIQGQVWADWNQSASPGTQGYQQNFFLRRARLIAGGEIGSDITFFFETDDPKLGITPKNLGAGFIVQDAVVQWRVREQFQLMGGLMIVPYCRQAMQSTTSYLTLDISPVTTVSNSPLQSSALRDTGFAAMGYLFNDRLTYRVGVFSGQRDLNGRNAMRTAGYLQYDFFAREKGYVYAGTALGTKKILAVDVGGDKQGPYRSYSANVASDTPVRHGDEVGLNFQYIHFDGRQKFLSIASQNNFLAEAAYYARRWKTQPFAKFETQRFVAMANRANDVDRYGAGVNYYVRGQNLKWTLQYLRALPKTGSVLRPSNEFTAQLQLFYF